MEKMTANILLYTGWCRESLWEGAVWVRIMNDYGIDDDTPSLAMSVLPEYRGMGIGTSLLKQLLSAEKAAGCAKFSLSVQKDNYK